MMSFLSETVHTCSRADVQTCATFRMPYLPNLSSHLPCLCHPVRQCTEYLQLNIQPIFYWCAGNGDVMSAGARVDRKTVVRTLTLNLNSIFFSIKLS